jgi:hypothetical protein
LLSDLDKNTVYHHTLGSKSIVGARKVVGAFDLCPFVRASKAVPHLVMLEIRNGLNGNSRAFFGGRARPDSVKEVVGFAGEPNNQSESVSGLLCLLDPNETSVASVGIAVNLFGSVDGFGSCTVSVHNYRKLVHEPRDGSEVPFLIAIARPGH